MGFAQPQALVFLGLLAPIVLLYLLKQRRRRVQVATLLFWEDLLRDAHRVTAFTRLRKLLSLLLQLAFAAMLALALAQPTFSAGGLGARRVVLIVDTSASMTVEEADGTRFDEARELARGVVRGLSMGDVCMLATAADRVEIVAPFTSVRRDLLEAVEALEPTHAPGAFAGALELPGNLAPDPRPTTVYVISDGAFDPVDVAWPEDVSLVYLPVGAARDNVGITAFSARPLPAAPRDFHVLFEITNETDADVRAPFAVYVDGDLVDAGEATVGARSRTTRSLRQYSANGGVVELRLDRDDAFALDNQAWAVLPPVRPIDVRLACDDPEPFLETALTTDDGLTVEMTTSAAYAADSETATVTVFDRSAPEGEATGDAVYIRDWPAALGLPAERWLERPLIAEWDRGHPVNRHVDYANVTIDRARLIEAHAGFDTLVASAEGPLVLAREVDGRRTLVIAFEPGASDLPLRVAFPVLVANAIRYAAGETPGAGWEGVPMGTVLSADEIDAWPTRRGRRDGAASRVLAPGETPEMGEEAPGLVAVTRQGVYQAVDEGGDPYPLFATNLTSRRESQIAPSATLPLEGGPVEAPRDGVRLGVAPWFALVALAFALSCAEWALYHRRIVE